MGESFDRLGADRLADEVEALVRRGILDARSPAGDALLDYREPPISGRGDRLARADARIEALEAELAEWKLTVKTLRETLADERQDRAFAGKGDTDADTPRS